MRALLVAERNMQIVVVGVRLTWLVALFGAASADCLYRALHAAGCRVDCFCQARFPVEAVELEKLW